VTAVPLDPEGAAVWDAASALARSGLLSLTGPVSGRPVLPPLAVPGSLDRLVAEIERQSAAAGQVVRVNWDAALNGRAAVLGLRRRGRVSANQSARLLPAQDGWVALNLPRPEDRDLLPALTGRPVGPGFWPDVARAAASTPGSEFVARARLLGLAATRLPEPVTSREAVLVVDRWGARAGAIRAPWHVVDLSSLWAGPVVARVLAEAGAQVTKLESATRPDGGRAIPEFYRWIHSPTERSVAYDLRTRDGQRRAAELIDDADVVIESSRPRALEQLGLGPGDRPAREGRVWLSITGYGRDGPGREWVAFGDDAAVAGGLVGWDHGGAPVFCGDAVADPITGLAGAAAVLGALAAGGGQLLDVAMSEVARACTASGRAPATGATSAARPDAAMGVSRPGGPSRPPSLESVAAGQWRLRHAGLAEPVRDRPTRTTWIERG
jgi:hypothetical protein